MFVSSSLELELLLILDSVCFNLKLGKFMAVSNAWIAFGRSFERFRIWALIKWYNGWSRTCWNKFFSMQFFRKFWKILKIWKKYLKIVTQSDFQRLRRGFKIFLMRVQLRHQQMGVAESLVFAQTLLQRLFRFFHISGQILGLSQQIRSFRVSRHWLCHQIQNFFDQFYRRIRKGIFRKRLKF